MLNVLAVAVIKLLMALGSAAGVERPQRRWDVLSRDVPVLALVIARRARSCCRRRDRAVPRSVAAIIAVVMLAGFAGMIMGEPGT